MGRERAYVWHGSGGVAVLGLMLGLGLLVACGGNTTTAPNQFAGATTAAFPPPPTTAATRPAAVAAAATSAPVPAAVGGVPVPGNAAVGATAASGIVVRAPAGSTTSGSTTSGSTADNALPSIPAAIPLTSDAKVIRNGTIALTVKDVPGTVNAVWNTATDFGGFVLTSSTRGVKDDLRADVTLRVPAERYRDALDRIRGYGVDVIKDESTAQDVSEEYVDLTARQKNLELTVAQLQSLLAQAKNVDETLRVQGQLNSVQGDLERVKGRLNFLDNRAAFSTITVSLQPLPTVVKAPPTQAPGWSFGRSAADAWARSVHGLQNVTDLLINIVVGGWWLLALGVVGVLVGRRLLHRYPIARLNPQPALSPAAPADPVRDLAP